MATNTGRKVFPWLIEVDGTGTPTGVRKPNVPTDPDYVPPVVDYVDCPVAITSTTTTTTTTAPITTTTTTTTTTAAITTTTTTTTTTAAITTTTTTAAPVHYNVNVNNTSVQDVSVDNVTVNTVPITVSGGTYPVGPSGVLTGYDGIGGTVAMEVFYHGMAGAVLTVVDSAGNTQTYNILTTAISSHVFTGVVMDTVTAVQITLN